MRTVPVLVLVLPRNTGVDRSLFQYGNTVAFYTNIVTMTFIFVLST